MANEHAFMMLFCFRVFYVKPTLTTTIDRVGTTKNIEVLYLESATFSENASTDFFILSSATTQHRRQ